MSLAPQFTTFGGQSLADTSVLVPISVLEGLNYSASATATDPEGDALTYSAYFLQQGMTFSSATQTFSWTPPAGTAGKKFNVKFMATTPSGGADAFIAQFSVSHATGPERALQAASGFRVITQNPVRDRFAIGTPPSAGVASLEIVDASGRRMARESGIAGHPLVWDFHATQPTRVGPGVYFFRVKSGVQVSTGKFVVVR